MLGSTRSRCGSTGRHVSGAAAPSASVAAWRDRGRQRLLGGHRIFTVEIPAAEVERYEPLLVIHGFPTSSFDFASVADRLARYRRVLLLDLVGYGFSEKPDLHYSVDLYADVVSAFTDELGIDELALLTHDLGDTVGGELLARQSEGRWKVRVRRRVLANGSIYIAMAQLSAGQQFLLGLPDERLDADALVDRSTIAASLSGTFSPRHDVAESEVSAMAELVTHDEGQRLLPRLIRYIEERRRNEQRFTGAIERHPSPLAVVWGADDPIAVLAMTERLGSARPDISCTVLDGVGHYPMVEAPERFCDALGSLEDALAD